MPQATTPLLSAWYKGLQLDSPEAEVSSPEPVVEEVVSNTRRHAPPLQEQGNNEAFVLHEADFPPLPTPSPPHPQSPATVPVIPQEPAPADNAHTMVTRGKDGIRKPNPRYVLHTVKSEVTKPRNIAEDTCDETGTWSLVPRPAGVHVIGCEWVHKIKLKADRTVEKLRSRLVARGNEQEEGVDFLET